MFTPYKEGVCQEPLDISDRITRNMTASQIPYKIRFERAARTAVALTPAGIRALIPVIALVDSISLQAQPLPLSLLFTLLQALSTERWLINLCVPFFCV